MAYTGEDVRRDAEQYRQEMRQYDEARRQMMQEYLSRVRAMNEKKDQHE